MNRKTRMMTDFKNKTAVLTGAGSGFGLECARIGARLGMNLVLVDVQQDALERAEQELLGSGAAVLAQRVDVSDAHAMDALGRAVHETGEVALRWLRVGSVPVGEFLAH